MPCQTKNMMHSAPRPTAVSRLNGNGSNPRLRDLVCKAPSAVHGNGLFARVRIEADRLIGTYEGPEARRDGTYVLWLNHQEEGNAKFDGFDLYAKRVIEPGEEITFNYSGADSGSWD